MKKHLWALVATVVFSVNATVVQAQTAGVVSAHPLATQAGEAVLLQGGNAFDAAAAVTAALGVVEPYGSGLGGGGFYLLHIADAQRDVMLDARETAPGKAHADMYLDEHGQPVDDLSIVGGLAAGIPGIPAALDTLTNQYGQLTLADNLAPAIDAARAGFAVHSQYQRLAGFRLAHMQANPTTAHIFLDQGDLPDIGHRIKQPQLANTLVTLAERGRAGFYQGAVAQSLVSAVNEAGGIWTLEDLADYDVVEREPISTRYQGFEVISAAPPSSGGVAIAQTLHVLEQLQQRHPQADEITQQHFLIEAMRRAYRDRAAYLGDPDFVDLPEHLLSPDYAAGLAAGIHPEKAGDSATLAPITLETHGDNTTHFAVLDAQGNYVAATLSLNYPFGAAVTDPDTGVLLNDEMDDFSKKPGTPNVYGLIGNQANAIAPGKRPLSSMSPTFVRNDEMVALLGTPGGSRIISMVLQAALAAMEDAPIADWVSAGRLHHQYLPDQITYEQDRVNSELIQGLKALGHETNPVNDYGDMQVLQWLLEQNTLQGVTDPRGYGSVVIIEPVLP